MRQNRRFGNVDFLHIAYVGRFLFAFLVVSSLGQLVVVALDLSVPDSLHVAFFAVAFLSQLVGLRSWRGFLLSLQAIILASTL